MHWHGQIIHNFKIANDLLYGLETKWPLWEMVRLILFFFYFLSDAQYMLVREKKKISINLDRGKQIEKMFYECIYNFPTAFVSKSWWKLKEKKENIAMCQICNSSLRIIGKTGCTNEIIFFTRSAKNLLQPSFHFTHNSWLEVTMKYF